MGIAADLPTSTEVLDRVGAARRQVMAGAAAQVSRLSDHELADSVASLARLESQVQAWQLELAAEADRRRVAEAAADTGTDAWLARLTGTRREMLKGGLLLAQRLEETYPTTVAALAEGSIRLEQARTIVDVLAATEDEATPAQREAAQELLIGKATGEANRSGAPMTAPQLRRVGRRIYRTIDTELHRRHLTASVRRSERTGENDTWLTLHDRGDGRYVGRFTLPERHGQLLQTVLHSLCTPRRYGHDHRGTARYDDTIGGPGSELGWADRLGIALCELIEHLPTDRLPRSAVNLLVTVDLDTLRSDLVDAGVATMTSGADLTASDARRLACEAGLVPAVLGTGSTPLDLGRTTRLHTDKQRQALALTHDSCAIATCDRPFAWTEVHHPHAWGDGGTTDLANALPLCWHHHRAAHDDRFELHHLGASEWILHRRRRPPPQDSSRRITVARPPT
ncbi:HNH endonuclease [Nocardioides panacisoli]|uniref:HNH endonuclease signature motif containing protein n=1 Tax=Nocardioides panacisoli TaxID=627624 RepID=UPI001C63928A|nr:HNH endonuclease signature motif containing protein [Nocardioides panacisoli]QYJ05307.1 HNH endonuclease [Nocardioides panacisoli]